MDEHGNWITDQQQLKEIALKFYSDLFNSDLTVGGEFIKGRIPLIFNEKLHELEQECNEVEVTKVIKEMSPSKAPRLDGLHATFFQCTWAIIGPSLTSLTK